MAAVPRRTDAQDGRGMHTLEIEIRMKGIGSTTMLTTQRMACCMQVSAQASRRTGGTSQRKWFVSPEVPAEGQGDD